MKDVKKSIYLIMAVLLLPSGAAAEWGLVVRSDVCGAGNAIIQLGDEMYVAAEYYSGVYLMKGDEVFGPLKVYGYGWLTRTDKESGEFFIQECHTESLDNAVAALCRR